MATGGDGAPVAVFSESVVAPRGVGGSPDISALEVAIAAEANEAVRREECSLCDAA